MVATSCRPSADDADGRQSVRMFMLLLSTKQVDYYLQAEEEFERLNPDINVIFEQFPGSSLKDYEIKVRLRYASGKAPDIWAFRENELAQFVDLGLLAPAPDYIQALVDSNSVNDLVRSAPYFNGICYGITMAAGWQALYYNKGMFREVGLDPDSPPTNWDELVEYADRLTIRDDNGKVQRAGISLRKTGFKPGTAEKWLTFYYAAGGKAFNDDGSRVLIDSPAGEAAYELYQTIMDRKIDALDTEGDQRGFGQGRVGMFIRELHVVDWLRTNYPEIEFGLAPIPPKDSTFSSLSSGGAYPMVVSSTAKYPEAAWRFLEFLASDEKYSQYIRMTQDIPVMKSVAEMPEFRDNELMQIFLSQEVMPPPKYAYDRFSLEIMGEHIERFFYGYETGEQALQRSAVEINDQLRVALAK